MVNKKITKSITKMFKDIDKERAAKPWYFKLWYWHIKPVLDRIESEVRSWPFRLKNGFDYRDTWSLDYSTAVFVLPRLKHLLKTIHGYPVEKGMTFTKWKKTIKKIIYSMEHIVKDEHRFNKRIQIKINEGLVLFGKYFRSLWS